MSIGKSQGYYAYHSALKNNKVEIYPDISRVDSGRSESFCYDIMEDMTGPLPSEYNGCDVFYIEPPWRAGFQVFNDRVKTTAAHGYSFTDFMRRIAYLILGIDAPVIVVWGKEAKRYLPNTNQTIKAIHNGDPALGYCYNLDKGTYERLFPEIGRDRSSKDIIEILATEFTRAGDFVCGYGNTGRIFRSYGKEFVLSDMNPKCIGYISEHIEVWDESWNNNNTRT